MLFYNGRWEMSQEKVKYIQGGEEITQFVGGEGHQWWVEFANKWEHTEIVEFIPVIPTEEQLSRFEEIKEFNVKSGFSGILSEYVENGNFPEDIRHPLRELQLEKTIKEQQQIIDAMLGVE